MPPAESLKPNYTGAGGIRIASFGHVLYAATVIALGIMGLATGEFTAIWSGVPGSWPARQAVAYLCAVICLGSGIGLLWSRTAALASRVLLGYFILWMLMFRVPLIFRAPEETVAWWACGETAVMMAGAWVLYAWFAGDRGGTRPGFLTGQRGLRVARVLYGLGLIPFGVAHFTYLARTVSMVPGWLPWHVGWACFTGGALIAAGIGIVFGVFARLAAVLSAWELALFTLLVWGPIVVSHPDAGQWAEIVDSVALTAAAWLVAESFRGAPWISRSRGKSATPLTLTTLED